MKRKANIGRLKPASHLDGSRNFDDDRISAELYRKFQELIYGETGIWLAGHKTALLIGRLSKRLRALRLSSMSEYFNLVSQPDHHHERMLMIDCITTNETHFFREPRHFEFLAHTVFPGWKEEAFAGHRERRIRIWSAGCSSGEEPFSLAMMLLDHFNDGAQWRLEILATDISMQVLAKARNGIFPISRSKEIPEKYLNSYMLKGTLAQDGSIKASPELRKLVTFSRLNLNSDSYGISGRFDLIFLRNVMIYFDDEAKKKVLTHLERYLAPCGYLFVGHSETLHGLDTILRLVAPGIYLNVAEKCPANANRCELAKTVLGRQG